MVAAGIVFLEGCAASSTTTVEVGTLSFEVEIADTTQSQRDGLSGREDLPEGTGMLFPFAEPKQRQVWMAGMKTSIDIAWIVNNQVLSVDTLPPCLLVDQGQCPKWSSPDLADALLEVPAGSLEGILPGTSVTLRDE
jgi:uncharacterized membrane protein (UPF0127 family)